MNLDYLENLMNSAPFWCGTEKMFVETVSEMDHIRIGNYLGNLSRMCTYERASSGSRSTLVKTGSAHQRQSQSAAISTTGTSVAHLWNLINMPIVVCLEFTYRLSQFKLMKWNHTTRSILRRFRDSSAPDNLGVAK